MTARRLPWLESLWPQLVALSRRGVHAVLLHGAAGVGKKNLALDLAEALLCRRPQSDGHACGECEECRLTAAMSHPDLRWVLPQALAETWLPRGADEDEAAAEAALAEKGEGDGKPARASREIRVEQVRALSGFLGIASYRGGGRAVLLAPAEAMNAVAANTLLKMLEEPPPATTFLLVSDALDEVLPTIRSRCVLVQVPAPAAENCLPWLKQQGIAEPAAALALASGAPLAALAIAAQETLSHETSAALYRLLEGGPALTVTQIAEGIGRDPPVAACLRRMQCWAVDLLLYGAGETVRYHPQRISRVAALAAVVRQPSLWRWLDELKAAAAAREHPLNARLVLESLFTGYLRIFDDRT